VPFRGVIFDFDGTIADTLPLCVRAFHLAAEPLLGRKLTDEEIVATFGPSEEGNVKDLVPHAPEACLEAYLRHYAEIHDDYLEPFPGMRELLSELRQRSIKMGLVTGKGPRTLNITLGRMRLQGIFDPIETGWAHGIRKREAIEDVMARWETASDDMVYVGDAPSDVVASRQAGIPVVGVVFGGFSQPERLREAGPDRIFTSVPDLASYLLD
jgi:phosphoglycolate phosphatase/pyrophosphatase PpaX